MKTFAPSLRRLAPAALAVLALLPLTPSTAGCVSGPKRTSDVVLEGYIDSFRVAFKAGEMARVTALGDGDIDIYVYDRFGKLVVKDVLADRAPSVRWTPSTTQTYTIKVANEANYDVDYVLETN